jgi:hypothetical protein
MFRRKRCSQQLVFRSFSAHFSVYLREEEVSYSRVLSSSFILVPRMILSSSVSKIYTVTTVSCVYFAAIQLRMFKGRTRRIWNLIRGGGM